MKRNLFVTSIAMIVMTGCATQTENKQAWEIKPSIHVRHGMVDAMAFYQLGRHHQSQGQHASAEQAFERALAIDPKNTDVLNALGTMYAERGELELAVATFKRVTELAPEKAYLYNNIGYALLLEGHHQEAIDALSRAVVLNPGYERAWVNLRAAAEKAGMTTLAALAAERRLPPRGSQAPQNAAIVTAIAATPDAPEAPKPSADFRLAMTPTLKTLTDPTESAAAIVASVAIQPVVQTFVQPPTVAVTPVEAPQPTAAITISEAATGSAAPAITVTEAGTGSAAPAIIVSEAATGSAASAITLEEVPYKTVAFAPTLESVAMAAAFQTAPTEPATHASAATEIGIQPVSSSQREEKEGVSSSVQGRVEVSNGNGVTRFATRVGRQLRMEGVRVSRITNHDSYKVEQSFIEYRPEWNDAARALRDRLGMQVTMQEAQAERKGTDIRIVLGRDSVQHVATLMKPRPHQGKAPPLLLTRNDR